MTTDLIFQNAKLHLKKTYSLRLNERTLALSKPLPAGDRH